MTGIRRLCDFLPPPRDHGRTEEGNCPRRCTPTGGPGRCRGERAETGLCEGSSTHANTGDSDPAIAAEDHPVAFIRCKLAWGRKRTRSRPSCSGSARRRPRRRSSRDSRAETGNGSNQRSAAACCRGTGAGSYSFQAAGSRRLHFPAPLLDDLRDFVRDFSDSNLELRRILGDGKLRSA